MAEFDVIRSEQVAPVQRELETGDLLAAGIGITNLVGEYRVQWNELMAAATIGALPVMVLYAILNRHLVSAITAGAVKA